MSLSYVKPFLTLNYFVYKNSLVTPKTFVSILFKKGFATSEEIASSSSYILRKISPERNDSLLIFNLFTRSGRK